MKILHITINEYETLTELQESWCLNIFINGGQLTQSKKNAEFNLKYQCQYFNIFGARVFWWSKELLDNKEYYILYECLFD